MTFDDKAYTNFDEGQIYALYIPFGEYKDEAFVKGSCEGYATLLIKIVPEYLTFKGTNTGEDAEAWYNDANWHQSTKGELYIDPNGEDKTDANGNDADLTAAFAPLHPGKADAGIGRLGDERSFVTDSRSELIKGYRVYPI